MAIALRSDGQISYPILSAGASAAALAVREIRSAERPEAATSRPGPRSHPRQTLGPSHREGLEARVQALIDYLEGGETIDDFLAGFPTVKREQVVAFLEEATARMTAKVS